MSRISNVKIMIGVSQKNDAQIMFGELLSHLRQHGFAIGVDHYLRLHELLDKVGDRCAPEDLRTLLAPIFATSPGQQEQFYRAFDAYFSLFEPATLKDAPARTALQVRPKESRRPQASAPPAPAVFQKKWLYVVAPIVLLLLIAGVVFLSRRGAQPIQNSNQPLNANAQPPLTNANTSAPPVIELPTQQPTFEQPITSEPNATTGEPGIVQPPLPPTQATPQASPAPSATPAGPNFYERHRTAIYLTTLFAPLALFLLYEWLRRRRKRILSERESRRKAPYVWPVRVDEPLPKLFESEQFYTAARLLRRRQVDEFYRLDVEATVAATIASLGFPSFRYKSASKPPEYLALIDRASFRDHQAQLFNELTKALETEGVFVVSYFYDEDPRVCRNESGDESLHLSELQNKYGTHRLLIFGDGAKLLDPLSGKLESWTTLLTNWQDRAVLTPAPPLRWSLRERALAGQFVLLPATLDGIQALVDYFEAAVTPDMRVWSRASDKSSATVDFDRPLTVKMLREHLGKDVFEWLCACAIYPELHWDLTLYIGQLPALSNNLVREQNLLRLVQLPWFRTGAMPDNLRWQLINELPPEKAKAIRTSLIQLLEKNPPPKQTVAEESYQLNLTAQRWLHSRSRQRLRELIDLMRRLPRSVALRDQTLVRYLEATPAPPLNVTLPARFRQLAFQNGLPAFGLKTSARLIFTFLAVGIAWTALLAFAPRTAPRNNLSALIANSLPAPTPELFPASPPYTDYTAQNTDPSVFPPVADPNANTAFPPAQQLPSVNDKPTAAPPSFTPPRTGGSIRFPRAPKTNALTEPTPDASVAPTPQPTPTPFPPLKPTQTAAQNAANQSQPAVQTEGAIMPPSTSMPDETAAQSQELKQQTAPNKVKSNGGIRPEDRARITAARLFQEGERLRAQAMPALLPQVVNKFQAALAGYRTVQDRAGEAAMLNNIGVVYNSMGEREKALEYYRQALAVTQELNNRSGQAVALGNAGKIYEGVGDKTLAQEFYDQSRSVWQSDLSPDRKMKASVSERQVKLVDATTGQELRTLTGHTASVFEVVFSPDGKRVASASDDGQVKIWNAASGEEQLTFGPGATSAYHLSFSPDGKTIITTEANGRTKTWDAATGKLLNTIEPQPAPAQSNAPK